MWLREVAEESGGVEGSGGAGCPNSGQDAGLGLATIVDHLVCARLI